ncbi:molybdate ABC transporter permease subunit [Paenibacillus larvae]
MNMDFWSPIQLSIQVSLLSTLLAGCLGTWVGKEMQRRSFRGKSVLETVLLLPLVLPPTVVGFVFIVCFGRQSPVGRGIEAFFGHPLMFTWWASVIASAVVTFPLMYQSAKAGFASRDRRVEEAARVDGASEWKVFWNVTFPQSSPALAGGIVLCFTRALGEFGATLMFAGNIPGRTQTVSTAIYMAFDSGNMRLAWNWVLVIVLLSFLLLSGSGWMNRQRN